MVQRVREMVCKRGGDKGAIIPAQMVDVWVVEKVDSLDVKWVDVMVAPLAVLLVALKVGLMAAATDDLMAV